MIQLKNVSKYYYSKGMISSGISKVDLTLEIGEFVVITGESGSGKTTLLNVIGGLDKVNSGQKQAITGHRILRITGSDISVTYSSIIIW